MDLFAVGCQPAAAAVAYCFADAVVAVACYFATVVVLKFTRLLKTTELFSKLQVLLQLEVWSRKRFFKHAEDTFKVDR